MKLIPFILPILICVLVVITVLDSGCMDVWTPDEPISPVADTTEYPTGYTGNIVGSVHYDVMICDGVDTQIVIDALQYIPQFYDFTIVQTNTNAYMEETVGDRIGMHIPLRDDLLIICKGDRAHSNTAGAAYITTGNGHRICAGVYDTDTPLVLGMRVYHEALHAQSLSGDADEMNANPLYGTVYTKYTIFEQSKYYSYLLAHDIGDV